MKKLLYSLIVLLTLFLGINYVDAYDVTLHLFHSSTCPHCADEKEYLKALEKKYDYLDIKYYEVHEKAMVTEKVRDGLGIKESYVPVTVVGSDYIIGFSKATAEEIESLIKKYHENKGCDAVDKILNNGDVDECLKQNKNIAKESSVKNIPLLGKVDVKKVSLPLISLVMGLVDGFNPCAMWVLIFLITMLINMKNKKRMWILGLTFIISSALVYLLFMLVYLNIATALIQTWLKYLIALVALIGGIINLRSFYKMQNKAVGCTVTDAKKRRKITLKIQKILAEKSFILAIIGIVVLAFSVNLIELACSAGLPVLFTQILALNNITGLSSALYIFIYLLFFMIDDIAIFTIAVVTFKVTGISNKYSKYSHLVGGIIMLVIGLLMAFKPEWLMFNF